MVARVSGPSDGRARLVRLTPRARPAVEAAGAEVGRVIDEWAAHVGQDRLDQVLETLRDLRELTDPWR